MGNTESKLILARPGNNFIIFTVSFNYANLPHDQVTMNISERHRDHRKLLQRLWNKGKFCFKLHQTVT